MISEKNTLCQISKNKDQKVEIRSFTLCQALYCEDSSDQEKILSEGKVFILCLLPEEAIAVRCDWQKNEA